MARLSRSDKVWVSVAYFFMMLSTGLVGALGFKTLWSGHVISGSVLIIVALGFLMYAGALNRVLVDEWRKGRA